MKKKIISIAVAAFSFCYANAQTKTGTTSQTSDQQFVTNASKAGMAEVDMGKMGESKAVNQRVKNFASMMVADHTKANDELKTIATSKNLSIPKANMKMNTDKMNAKTGSEFDKNFMEMMVSDHKKAVSLFENESKNGNDAELKSFAVHTLPTLQMHLDSAMVIQSALKNKRMVMK